MKSREFKTFIGSDGKRCRFDCSKFKDEVKKYKLYNKSEERKLTIEGIRDDLADILCVSSDAVKNWYFGYNGPSSFNQVKKIAEYLGIDYECLCEKEHIMEEKRIIEEIKAVESQVASHSESSREIVKVIYQMLLKINRDLHKFDYGMHEFCYIDGGESLDYYNVGVPEEGISESDWENWLSYAEDKRKWFDSCKAILKDDITAFMQYCEDNFLDIPAKTYDSVMEFYDNHIGCYASLDKSWVSVSWSVETKNKMAEKYTDEDGRQLYWSCSLNGDHDEIWEEDIEILSNLIYKEFFKDARETFREYFAQ